MTMNSLRIPVEHHTALAVYFDVILKCRFVLDGEECAPNEVFHAAGFLPLVADVASRASQQTFSQAIGIEIVNDESALLGKRVVLPEAVDQALLLKLLWGAEIVFRPTEGKAIDLLPIYEYCWSPERGRKPAPWLPAHLRH
jgi:hypothetical protein